MQNICKFLRSKFVQVDQQSIYIVSCVIFVSWMLFTGLKPLIHDVSLFTIFNAGAAECPPCVVRLLPGHLDADLHALHLPLHPRVCRRHLLHQGQQQEARRAGGVRLQAGPARLFLCLQLYLLDSVVTHKRLSASSELSKLISATCVKSTCSMVGKKD